MSQKRSKLSAVTGELGLLKRLDGDGRVSDEISITVRNPSGAGYVNVPTLVRGQVNVKNLLSSNKVSPLQRRIALARARDRVAKGQYLPEYPDVKTAVDAAKKRSKARGRLAENPQDYVSEKQTFRQNSP